MGIRLPQPTQVYRVRFSLKHSSRGVQGTVQSTAGQSTGATVYRVLFSRIPNDFNKLSTVLDSAVHEIMEYRKTLQSLGLRIVKTAYKEAWPATLVGHASFTVVGEASVIWVLNSSQWFPFVVPFFCLPLHGVIPLIATRNPTEQRECRIYPSDKRIPVCTQELLSTLSSHQQKGEVECKSQTFNLRSPK